MAGLSASIPLLGDVPAITISSGGGGGTIFDVAVEDDFTVTASPAYAWRPGAAVHDAIIAQVLTVPGMHYGAVATESLRLLDVLRGAYSVGLHETLTVADIASAVRGVFVMERLRITENVIPAAVYRRAFADAIRASDGAHNFFGGELLDSVVITDTLAGRYCAIVGVQEALTLTDLLGHSLVLRVTVDDEATVTASDALRMVYSPTITENIEIAGAYISPGGGFTVWAVNARSGGVTEYTNFEFNSFAQLGRRYIAASDAGLFELDGDKDGTADIITTIRSGFAQFAGTHFAAFKAAYLGVTGGGDYLLRVITGQNQTYTYAVKAEDGRSTKINVGKGLRARYFAFELVSAGQDFDLDLVEFVPIVMQRRV